ncbi:MULTISPECIES: alanine racemase [unclassified Lentimonas]|uniref:alanine racemase n=1 Tax=unclassified Lentimonas TaxID=2630993 RepID=UPI00132235E2|nr:MULTISPECIES: alanine racemase [unclassified Lentimonas]CAA6677931.1 Alanine racemase (EC [Lentimonas sp. CC4]CAA6684035.1 Alanine racemase (EC [Lentimonas sp. CC6]CAA7076589.1 Alanine racemase (EC [Lentimonas sp. CC4]CAA7170082.1 Alanine racemase (EC [Lentimonas sp. CC21]CAA7181367.1 Alanine racemase (EC [Lentimonas sp. CC8]
MDTRTAPRTDSTTLILYFNITNLPHRCWAEIDLAAFERNLKRIQAALPSGVRYVSVVKADAYGHGMPQMVRRLMQSGVDYFAVANVHEAADIRHMGKGWPILVLSPLLPEEDNDLVDYDLIGTVSTREEAERFNALAEKRGTSIQIHLKIDTGMGRLGVWHEEALALLDIVKNLPHLSLKGIYTHFSSADSDRAFTRLQRDRFLAVLEQTDTTGLLIHADNSASLNSLSGESPFNAVRVGLLQLGIPPYPDSVLGRVEVEPVFSFHTRIGIVKDLPVDTDISYGRSHRLTRDTRIAVLTAGYGDGIPLELSNAGAVLINGQHCPILGRVTMDQTIVDVTDLDGCIQSGDHAILIGRSGGAEITATTFSETAGTIPWEALCSITKRVERVYVGSREI